MFKTSDSNFEVEATDSFRDRREALMGSSLPDADCNVVVTDRFHHPDDCLCEFADVI